MPLLQEEPSLYPPGLLDESCWTCGDRRWMVLYTKPRQEKSLSRDLFRHHVPFYLPLVKKTLRYARRKLSSFAPLFGGYVFLCGTEAERTLTLATNRVLRIIPVEDPERLVHDLSQLRRLIAANMPLTIESRLAPGQRVSVKSGPFAGVEGTVLRRQGEVRLLVSVNFLQKGASIEIEDYLLEPID